MASAHSSRTVRQILLCVGFALGLICVALFCFYHLGFDELNSYDEARHGVSAYEMLQTGDALVTTWEYQPDYWNLKPPLSEWLIVLGYKLFGYNAFGLRFYSALSMFLTALICAVYLWQEHSAVSAVFCLFLFPTFGKLYSYHCARTADADALFILFYIASILCMCKSRKNFRWVYAACLCFALAFLAKSFHAGLIAIFVLCALFFLGHFRTMRIREYVLCAFCSLLPVGCWAVARYLKDGTAFLAPMFLQDVVNRSATAIEGHSAPWYYYAGVLIKNFAPALFILLVILIFFGFVQCCPRSRSSLSSFWASDYFLFLLGILIPLVIFTFAKTKLINYIYCIYPLIALIASVSLTLFLKGRSSLVQGAALLVCFALTLFVVQKNFRTIIPSTDQHDYTLQEFLSHTELQSGDRVYMLHDTESYGVGTDWTQAQVMEAEWLTDCIPQKGGGTAFERTSGSYLIASASLLEDFASYELLCQTDTYVLLYNP